MTTTKIDLQTSPISQLQYLKRLQYTAKNMTGLGKVAKEANKGLKFLDTRYIDQFKA